MLVFHIQCDQIGRFLKCLDDKISRKRSPNDWQLFGLFLKTHSYVKMNWLLFGILLGKFGPLFIWTSGHTVQIKNRYLYLFQTVLILTCCANLSHKFVFWIDTVINKHFQSWANPGLFFLLFSSWIKLATNKLSIEFN